MAFRQGETAGERAMWGFTDLVSVGLGIVLFTESRTRVRRGCFRLRSSRSAGTRADPAR
jgi:hypothetical protein